MAQIKEIHFQKILLQNAIAPSRKNWNKYLPASKFNQEKTVYFNGLNVGKTDGTDSI